MVFKKILINLSIVFLLGFPAGLVLAGIDMVNLAPAAISRAVLPQTEVIGTVSGISGNNISIFANNTSYAVDAGTAKITGSGKAMNISDLKIGNNLIILGQVNGFNISAASIFVNAIGKPASGKAFIGVVTELSTGTFVFQPKDSTATAQTVNISAGTVFTRGGLPAAITDLTGGQTLVVTGEEDPNAPELINANRVEIVISSEPPKQIEKRGSISPATAKNSFFGGIFKTIGKFFTKIFSWL